MSKPTTLELFIQKASQQGAEIHTTGENPWISDLETRLPFRIPALYREILEKCAFTPFELNGIVFFANVGDATDPEDIAAGCSLTKAFRTFFFIICCCKSAPFPIIPMIQSASSVLQKTPLTEPFSELITKAHFVMARSD